MQIWLLLLAPLAPAGAALVVFPAAVAVAAVVVISNVLCTHTLYRNE